MRLEEVEIEPPAKAHRPSIIPEPAGAHAYERPSALRGTPYASSRSSPEEPVASAEVAVVSPGNSQGASEGEQPGPATTPSGAEGGSSRHLSLDELGLAGTNRFMGSRASASAAESPVPDGHAAQDSLRAGLDAHDRDLGLGPAGPVITELERVTLESTAPVNGHASFVAVVDAAGLVVGLDVVEASEGMASWRDVAATSLVGLKGKKLPFARPGAGQTMRIEVSSRIETPSGRDPGT